jgi:uncharacterized repeat protein (TIGR01451 family)
MKKIYIFIIFLVVSHTGISQAISISSNLAFTQPSGTVYDISINPTCGNCSSIGLSVDIGQLEYVSSIIPQGSNIAYGSNPITITDIPCIGGQSQTIIIRLRFPRGITCNNASQKVIASIISSNCITNTFSTELTLNATATNNWILSLTQHYNPPPFSVSNASLDFGQYMMYEISIQHPNNYNGSLNMYNPKFSFRVANCAEIVGVYKNQNNAANQYYNPNSPIDYTTVPSGNTQTVTWDYQPYNNTSPQSLIVTNSHITYYQIWVRYPCYTCSAGLFNQPRVDLTGLDKCDNPMTLNNQVTTSFSGQNACDYEGTITLNCSTNPKCPQDTCHQSTATLYFSSAPNGLALTTNSTWEVNLPTQIYIDTEPQIYGLQPNTTTFQIWYGNSWITPTTPTTTSKFRWIFDDNISQPYSIYCTINLKYYPNTVAGTTVNLNQIITIGSNTLSRNCPISIPECNTALWLYKCIIKNNQWLIDYTALPNEIIRYRFKVQNNGTLNITNATLSETLNANHIFSNQLNLKYGYNTNTAINNDLIVGSNNISTTAIGTNWNVAVSGQTLTISGINLPSCPPNNYLIFEFDVKINSGVVSGTTIPNKFSFYDSQSNETSITIGNLASVYPEMKVRCKGKELWNDSINVKPGDDLEFLMKLTNNGSIILKNIKLINEKPMSSDYIVYSNLPQSRGSDFPVNFNCGLPVSNNSIPISSKFSLGNGLIQRPELQPPLISGYSDNPNWVNNCSPLSNWLMVSPTNQGYELMPGQSIEVIINANVGSGANDAYNSFSYVCEYTDASGTHTLNSDNSNTVKLVMDNVGCTPIEPTLCCDIEDITVNQPINISVSDHSNYYGFNFNLPINTGTGLFEEIRASLVNFELKYSEPECPKCYNNYSYMGTFLLQSSPLAIVGLQKQSLAHYNTSAIPGSQPFQNGVREIIWNGLPSPIGNVSPHFEILFPKPILPNCCNVRVKVCIKLVFKNADCDICEKYVCVEFDKNGFITTSSR